MRKLKEITPEEELDILQKRRSGIKRKDIIEEYVVEHTPIIDEMEEKYYNMFSRLFDDTFRECEWRLKILLKKDSIYKIKSGQVEKVK
jgi:hypothetical protein